MTCSSLSNWLSLEVGVYIIQQHQWKLIGNVKSIKTFPTFGLKHTSESVVASALRNCSETKKQDVCALAIFMLLFKQDMVIVIES